MAKTGVRSGVPIAIGIVTGRQPGFLQLQRGAMCQDIAAEKGEKLLDRAAVIGPEAFRGPDGVPGKM